MNEGRVKANVTLEDGGESPGKERRVITTRT
uniref:Uncharacterized protein n=1 Tax=Rhizophora mucronata TaxID=61149 RepID=A0A2P2J8K9_RHIMU